MAQVKETNVLHHIKGVKVALEVMSSLGFNPGKCLVGTGLTLMQIEDPAAQFTLDQEHAFYRQLLKISGDPLIGIKLGKAFRPETFGIFGYAMLSSKTLQECFDILYEFGELTYSFFRFSSLEIDGKTGTQLQQNQPIPDDLLQLYSDRDIEAGFTLFDTIGMDRAMITEVWLAHNAVEYAEAYASNFDCPVKLGQHCNAVIYKNEPLTHKLAQHDADTAAYCRIQCQGMLEKIRAQNSSSKQVAELLFSTPGKFMSQDEVAKTMGISIRTLRRNLKDEGSSFQEILKDVRLQLAKNYLGSSLSIERITELLGYSEVSTFSRSFKQWTSYSPLQYRQISS